MGTAVHERREPGRVSTLAAPLCLVSGFVRGRFFAAIQPYHEQLTHCDIPAEKVFHVAVFRVNYILPVARWELWNVAADTAAHAEMVARYHLCYSTDFEVMGEAEAPGSREECL